LPSEVIGGMVESDRRGTQRRGIKTIDSLTSELLERQLNNEED
jgi:hypothetical protein